MTAARSSRERLCRSNRGPERAYYVFGFILRTRAFSLFFHFFFSFFKAREQHDQICSEKGPPAVLWRMFWQRRVVGRLLKSSLK